MLFFIQVKCKIEIPYGWLQDRIVRICPREGIHNIIDGNKVLEAEEERYHFRQSNSVSGEVS
jgi:hypothetical protein